MTCEKRSEAANMTTKMKLHKMLQESKGMAQISNRRLAPRPPLLFLMQLRSQEAQTSTPRRRLFIESSAPVAPAPIKINHIKPNEPSIPVVVQ